MLIDIIDAANKIIGKVDAPFEELDIIGIKNKPYRVFHTETGEDITHFIVVEETK